MITEHIKLAKNHLRIGKDEQLSDEIVQLINAIEEFMENGSKRNNIGRDALVACFGLMKVLGREKALQPVRKKNHEEMERAKKMEDEVAEEAPQELTRGKRKGGKK